MTFIGKCFIGFKVNVKTVHKNTACYNAEQYLTWMLSHTFTLFPPYFSGIMLNFIFRS